MIGRERSCRPRGRWERGAGRAAAACVCVYMVTDDEGMKSDIDDDDVDDVKKTRVKKK